MYRIVKRIIRTVTTVTLLARWEKDSPGEAAREVPITLPASVSLTEEEVVDKTNKTKKTRKSKSISNKGEYLMSTLQEQNKDAARNFIELGFNQKNPAALEAYFSSNLTDHALPPMLPPGLEGRKMFYGAFVAAFPDIHLQINELVAEGDKLVTSWTAHGTHQGELMGIPPTGKSVTVSGIAIDRFENGQSVEHWEIFDQMGLMQQLGVIPTPG